MDKKLVQGLKIIKDHIKDNTYQILQKPQWDKFADNLSNAGANILEDVQQQRELIRDFKIPFVFFCVGKRLIQLEDNFNRIAKHFDLFFDTSRRWLRANLDGNKYAEYQILTRNHVSQLSEHCQSAVDYLNHLISSKRTQSHHLQILFISLIAILIAIASLIISTLYK
jgi:hypothetical protein